jgi:hypothetical protein
LRPTRTGLALNVSQTLATDIKLTVGAETMEVTVSADALSVQTESNDVSTLISGEQVTSIATENRNFTALAALGLGVSSNLPNNNPPSASASSASISVNGLRESHNIWLLDGAEADDRGGAGGMSVMPSMDSIAQFQVLASNYPPDYGIASGATFSLALKSGSQKFHGEGWEFFRNDDLDANDFFNKYQRQPADYTPVPKLRQNIFGATLADHCLFRMCSTRRGRRPSSSITRSGGGSFSPVLRQIPTRRCPMRTVPQRVQICIRGSRLCNEPGHLCSNGSAGTGSCF